MAEGESGLGLVTSLGLCLNCKRLTVSYLRHLASELEVPTSATTDELPKMINGKLSEAGKDVFNMQVVLFGTDPSREFSLKDERGKFLTVPAAEPEHQDRNTPPDSEEEQKK